MVSLRIAPVLALQAALVAVAALLAFAVGLRDSTDEARELAFMTLVIAHLVAVFNFRSLQRPLKQIGLLTNRALLAAVVTAMALQFLPFYLGPLNGPFHVSPLSLGEWGLVLTFALVAFVPVELMKLARLRRERR
jgi:Ca2+-transporting ATPase